MSRTHRHILLGEDKAWQRQAQQDAKELLRAFGIWTQGWVYNGRRDRRQYPNWFFHGGGAPPQWFRQDIERTRRHFTSQLVRSGDWDGIPHYRCNAKWEWW